MHRKRKILFKNNGDIMRVNRSHIFSNSTRALVDLIKCKCCDGMMIQVSGRAGGYYGCYNAKRESCDNKLLISRRQVEVIILNDLKEKFLTMESVKHMDELLLKDLLKTLELEPAAQLIKNCSYYVAHTSIQTIALLEEYKSEF